MSTAFSYRPVTADRWAEFETLFGPQGGFYGCWCVALRLPHKERTAMKPDARRDWMQGRIADGPPPGILFCEDDEPIGWVQVGPRSDVPQFNSPRTVSRPLEPEDAHDPSIWAISCFLLKPGRRGEGLSHRMLEAAIDHACKGGARFVEACPIDHTPRSKSVILCVGSTAIFDRAGFETIARRKDGRPLMRLELP